MLLQYLAKYECQKTGGNLKYVLRLMINHKVVQTSIQVMMGYFITNNYIFQFPHERILKISEHLAKLQTKWLIVSVTPHSPQTPLSSKMRTRKISTVK